MKTNPFKILWLAAAFLFLGIGAVGVILPVSAYDALSSACIFLLCEGLEAVSQLVYGNETL